MGKGFSASFSLSESLWGRKPQAARLINSAMEFNAQRKYRRVPLAASVTLSFEEDGEKLSVEAMAADISLSGIGLYAGRQIREGTVMNIEINFIANVGKVKTEAVRGKVIFSHYIRKAHFMGADFLEELDPASQPDLYARIQDVLERG